MLVLTPFVLHPWMRCMLLMLMTSVLTIMIKRTILIMIMLITMIAVEELVNPKTLKTVLCSFVVHIEVGTGNLNTSAGSTPTVTFAC